LVSTYEHKKKSEFCDFLNEKGRCPIHKANPLSCRLELIKFLRTRNKGIITKKLFGRGWEMKTLTGVGALCEMVPFNYETFSTSDLPLLKEIQKLAICFFLPNWLDKVIDVLEKMKDNLKKGILPKENIRIY